MQTPRIFGDSESRSTVAASSTITSASSESDIGYVVISKDLKFFYQNHPIGPTNSLTQKFDITHLSKRDLHSIIISQSLHLIRQKQLFESFHDDPLVLLSKLPILVDFSNPAKLPTEITSENQLKACRINTFFHLTTPALPSNNTNLVKLYEDLIKDWRSSNISSTVQSQQTPSSPDNVHDIPPPLHLRPSQSNTLHQTTFDPPISPPWKSELWLSPVKLEPAPTPPPPPETLNIHLGEQIPNIVPRVPLYQRKTLSEEEQGILDELRASAQIQNGLNPAAPSFSPEELLSAMPLEDIFTNPGSST